MRSGRSFWHTFWVPGVFKNLDLLGLHVFIEKVVIFRIDALAYVKRMFLMVQALMRGIQGASRIGKIVTSNDFFYNKCESSKFNKKPILVHPQKRHFV